MYRLFKTVGKSVTIFHYQIKCQRFFGVQSILLAGSENEQKICIFEENARDVMNLFLCVHLFRSESLHVPWWLTRAKSVSESSS